MTLRRVHLVVGNSRRAKVKVACGRISPLRRTTVPPEVTCAGCKGSLRMADAEKKFYTSRGKGAW